jgi:SAM-dependent methyltransferase
MVSQWFTRNQHPENDINNLNLNGICPKDKFLKNVSYRTVDMNNIPCDLKGFDFCWSCSSIEHLGGKGKSFTHILKSLETLKPGGLLVFTTEYNCTSDVETNKNPYCYLFTKRDLTRLTNELVSMGNYVYPLNLLEGLLLTDKVVDVYPYIGKIQIRKKQGKYINTPIRKKKKKM